MSHPHQCEYFQPSQETDEVKKKYGIIGFCSYPSVNANITKGYCETCNRIQKKKFKGLENWISNEGKKL